MVLRLYAYGAWIESDGTPLEEHSVEVVGNVISCYVCSEEGKKFSLHFDDDGSQLFGYQHLSDHFGRAIEITMDGSRVDSCWGGHARSIVSEGAQVGDTLLPYVFSPIHTTDDDDVAARDDPKIEHLGTIQVDLRRGILLGPGTHGHQISTPSTDPIHERSKKAGSHRVGYATAIHRQRNPVKVDYIDNAPWLTFRFLYRKRDMLKAQGILPPSPSPSPPPNGSPGPSTKVEGEKNKGKGVKREREENWNDDPIEISDDEDIGTLQEELKRIQDRIARKKAKKPVKQEPVSSADDIIDLT